MATLKARKIYSDDQRTVVIVRSADIRHEKRGDVLGLMAWSKPVAVVVLSESGARAVDMSAQPLDLSGLLDDAEGLSALLER